MKQEKPDPLRKLVSSREVIEINALSELSPSARVLAWELFILATCTQDKTSALNKFFERTVRQADGEKRKFNHILVNQDCFVVPKSYWLSERTDLDKHSRFWSDFRIEKSHSGQDELHSGVLRVLNEREWQILKEKKQSLEKHYPFDDLTQSQIERDLVIVANEMGFDLTNPFHMIRTNVPLNQAAHKTNNDHVSQESVRDRIESALYSMKKRGLLED